MKKFRLALFLGMSLYVLASVFSSCKHGCGREGEAKTSSAKSDDSHNMGLNCLNCHSNSGDGEGCFSIGGTAYMDDLKTTYPGCTIRLYTEPQGKGTLVASLVSDEKGNFYTGSNIKWGGGLFPSITSPGGNTEYMQEKITSGACNSCHNQTTDKIFIY